VLCGWGSRVRKETEERSWKEVWQTESLCPPEDSCVEISTPNVMVFGTEAFVR
jgi:hypothetical protein